MLNHILTEDSIHMWDEGGDCGTVLKFGIDELPAWRFTSNHRRGLWELAQHIDNDAWIKVAHGVVLVPVPFGGVRYPLFSMVVCRNKIPSPQGVEDISMLMVLILPPDFHAEILNEVQGSLSQLFCGRFLQERLRLCTRPAEVLDLMNTQPAYHLAVAV